MLDSLLQVLASVSLALIAMELIWLRLEVQKCIRILYAVAKDLEGGEQVA